MTQLYHKMKATITFSVILLLFAAISSFAVAPFVITNFDTGVAKDGTATLDDEYCHAAGALELSFPYADKDTNLISYWRFENNGLDETDNNHDAEGTNAVYTSSGKFDGCYDLEADLHNYVAWADDSAFSFGNGTTNSPFSLSMWLKIESFTYNPASVISKDDGVTERKWAMILYNPDCPRLFCKNNGGNDQIGRDCSITVSAGPWYHVVCTYDGGTNYAGIKIYINNVERSGASAISGVYTAMVNTIAHLDIGRYCRDSSTNIYNYDGLIDEVKIYGKALNSTEITNLYNSGIQYKTNGTWTSAA